MSTITGEITDKTKLLRFVWQLVLLLVSLYVMTLGVSLCVRSELGSSVIATIPMAFAIAGEEGLAPGLTIGTYSYLLNVCFVLDQILILRRKFELVQLFQLLITRVRDKNALKKVESAA